MSDFIAIGIAFATGIFVTFASRFVFFHYGDAIDGIFARLGPREKVPKPSINGVYYSIYWRPNRENELRKYASLYLLRRKHGLSADQITFTNLFGGNNQCLLKGRIDKLGFISGEWRSGSREYHGSFQFNKLRGHNAILGKWLGFNANNKINCGIWIFINSHQKLMYLRSNP